MKTAIRYAIFAVILMALVYLRFGWTTFSIIYMFIIVLYCLVCTLIYKPLAKRRLKKNVQKSQQEGKPSFDPISKLEFYEDKLVEIGTTKRTEQGYDGIEGVHIVEDRYIFIYDGHSSSFVLPVPQVKAQLNQEEFIDFLSQKCSKVEYYCK